MGKAGKGAGQPEPAAGAGDDGERARSSFKYDPRIAIRSSEFSRPERRSLVQQRVSVFVLATKIATIHRQSSSYSSRCRAVSDQHYICKRFLG